MHDRDHLTVERCAETALSDGNSRHHTAYYLPKQQAPSKSFPNAHIIVYQEFRRTFFGNLSVHCCGVRPRDEQSATLQTIRFLSRLSFLKVKVKVNYTLEQATKAQRESRCIALLFLQPRRQMGGGCSTPRPGPRERPGTHCIRGWVGPRAGLDGCGKSRLYRNSIPGPSSP